MTENDADLNESVRVAVRIRPLMGQELVERCTECIEVDSSTNSILVIGSEKVFQFDHVFHPKSNQSSIYDQSVSPLIDALFEGYNATCFAYGQTGSGKTYTMGSANDGFAFASGTSSGVDEQLNDTGIIPRAVRHIFNKITESKISMPNAEFYLRVQFLELYGESLRDLLDPIGVAEGKTVLIREGAGEGIQLEGASEESVKTPHDMLKALERGTLCRTTASTKMNMHSSRSHAIFTIILEQHLPVASNTGDAPADTEKPVEDEAAAASQTEFRTAKFHFVDLAGSERAKRTGATGKRLREGININKGLLALGNVISALSKKQESKKPQHVPYRNSKLTRMLQDSLGGNSRTLMIACVSPADVNYEETLNTLRYADRAKNIKNNAVINRDPATSQIAMLKAQVAALKAQLLKQQQQGNGGAQASDAKQIPSNELGSLSHDALSMQSSSRYSSMYEGEIKRLNAELELERRTRMELEDELRSTKEQLDCLHEAHQVLVTDTDHLGHSSDSIQEDDSGLGAKANDSLLVKENSDELNTSHGSLKYEDDDNDDEILPQSVIASLLEEDDENREVDGAANHDGVSNEISSAGAEGAAKSRQENIRDMSQHIENDEEAVQLRKKYQKTQAALRKMVNTYDKTLRSKQKIMEQVIQERKRYEAMRQHYESKMGEMNEEVKETQCQRDELDHRIKELEKKAVTEATANEANNLKKELKVKNDRLRELEVQSRKLAEAEKLSLKFQQKEKNIQDEIAIMKRAKVEYQRKMEEESKKYKDELSDRAKEILQLKRAQFQLSKDKTELSARTARDEMLLKVKTEQVTAMQRKLREAQKLAMHSQKLSTKEKEQREMLENLAKQMVKRDEELQDLKLALAKKESAIQRRTQLCEELERLKLQAEQQTREAEEKALKAERDKAHAEAALREVVRDIDAGTDDDDLVERDAIEELEQRLEAAESEIMFRDTQIQQAAANIDRAQASEGKIVESITDKLVGSENGVQKQKETASDFEYASSGARLSSTQELNDIEESAKADVIAASSSWLKTMPLDATSSKIGSDMKIESIEQANEVCKVLMQLFVDSKKQVKKQQTEIKRLKMAQKALENQQESQRRKAIVATLSTSISSVQSRSEIKLNPNDRQQQDDDEHLDRSGVGKEETSVMKTPQSHRTSMGSLRPNDSTLESQRKLRTLEEQLKNMQAEPESVPLGAQSRAAQLLPIAFYVPLGSAAKAAEAKAAVKTKRNHPHFLQQRVQAPSSDIAVRTKQVLTDATVFDRLSLPSNFTGIHKRKAANDYESVPLSGSKGNLASAGSVRARNPSPKRQLVMEDEYAAQSNPNHEEMIGSTSPAVGGTRMDQSMSPSSRQDSSGVISMKSEDDAPTQTAGDHTQGSVRIASSDTSEKGGESPGWFRVAKKTTESYSKKLELDGAERMRKLKLEEARRKKKLDSIRANILPSVRPSMLFGKSRATNPNQEKPGNNENDDSEDEDGGKENSNIDGAAGMDGKNDAHVSIFDRLTDPRFFTGTQRRKAEENQAVAALSQLGCAAGAESQQSNADGKPTKESIKLHIANERERRKKNKIGQGV